MDTSPFFATARQTPLQVWHPVIVGVTETQFTTNTTQHLVNFPAVTYAGNLLLMFWSNDGTATATTPTNFSQIYNVSSLARSCCYAKIAAGNEGGTTVDVVTSAIEAGSAQMFQIRNWGGTIASHVLSATATGGTGTTRTAPTLTPAFGAVEALWFIAAHASDTITVSTLPTGFSDLLRTAGTVGTAGGQTHTGRAYMTLASLAPGNFTLSATTTGSWSTATVAVKGTR